MNIIQNKKNLSIAAAVLILALINFVVAPLVDRNKAATVVRTVLNYWVADDVASSFKYFSDPAKSPAIYDLTSYTIKNVLYEKHQRDFTAKFFIKLAFPEGHIFPSGRIWICELVKDRGRWVISRFYLPED